MADDGAGGNDTTVAYFPALLQGTPEIAVAPSKWHHNPLKVEILIVL